jgi:1-acyl-sn-glycerol-3-phosphate acyltransferase
MTASRFSDTRSFPIAAISSLVYSILHILAFAILKIYFKFSVHNGHRVPRSAPFIVIANHVSFMDPVVLQCACPQRIVFLMTESYYNPVIVRCFFSLMCCIPLKENTPYNIGALRRALDELERDNVVGIFPEGSISREGVLRDAMPGTLLLAQKTGVPILPAYIYGTYEALPRNARFPRKAAISVSFGQPLAYESLAEGLSGKEGLRAATGNLMKHMISLSHTFKMID